MIINPYQFAAAGSSPSSLSATFTGDDQAIISDASPTLGTDLDIRIDLFASGAVSGGLLQFCASGISNFGFNLLMTSATSLRFGFSENGSSFRSRISTYVFPNPDARTQLRVTRVASTGQIRFFERFPNRTILDGSGWIEFDFGFQPTGAINQPPSSVLVSIGDRADKSDQSYDDMKVYEAAILDGINGTALVHYLGDDFTSGDANGDTAVSSLTGETWTLDNVTVS